MSTVDENRVDELGLQFEFVDTLDRACQKAADRDCKVRSAFVYVLEAEGLGLFKIGRSNNAISRLASYKTECPVPCLPIVIVRVGANDADYIERYLHRHFGSVRHKGEWFRLEPDHIAQIKPLVAEAAAKGLKTIDRELSRLPVIYDAEQAARERELEAHMRRLTERHNVPTGELILDRIALAIETDGKARMVDVTRGIDRKPRHVHEAMRCLLIKGDVAIRSPRRHPMGSFNFDEYRHCDLLIPDATCDWERTSCGSEILVSEPTGRFVPEFFGRTIRSYA